MKLDYSNRHVIVTSIMDTPANRQARPNAGFVRWPKVAEVASTIAFLASPQNTTTRDALVPAYGQN